MDFGNLVSNLLGQMAFFHLSAGNYIMIGVALVFLYLAIAKGFEPLLLIPIAFGMLLVNIYPDIMYSPEQTSNGVGGLLYYFFTLDEWSILPSLIFMGVGAMTDFGPLIANPISFLMGAAAQLGIYSAYFFAILLGFSGKEAACISIIGGADGPTAAEEPKEEPEEKGGLNPALILLPLLLIGGGGAFYYFKFVKDKSSTKGNDDLGEYDFEDEYEDTEVEYLDDTPKEDESV